MKITVVYHKSGNKDTVEVDSAVDTGIFRLDITFSDGRHQVVDFRPFLAKAVHPAISKYLDEPLFQKFDIVDGNINWNDYDLIFPVSNLYEGKVT